MPVDNNQNDVDPGVVGTGCATGCGTGCAVLAVIVLIMIAMGVEAGIRSPMPKFLGFLGGLLCHVITGYAVARAAREKRRAVNLHVFVVGGLFMVLGLFSFVNPQFQKIPDPQVRALSMGLGMISWFLTIPMMLLGASWGQEEEPTSPT